MGADLWPLRRRGGVRLKGGVCGGLLARSVYSTSGVITRIQVKGSCSSAGCLPFRSFLVVFFWRFWCTDFPMCIHPGEKNVSAKQASTANLSKAMVLYYKLIVKYFEIKKNLRVGGGSNSRRPASAGQPPSGRFPVRERPSWGCGNGASPSGASPGLS